MVTDFGLRNKVTPFSNILAVTHGANIQHGDAQKVRTLHEIVVV